MTVILRALRLLAIVVWVGGLIFFAFVVAPLAFHLAWVHELPSTHAAGMIVAGSLAALHPMAEVCGIVFLFATALYWFRVEARRRVLVSIQLWLVLLMLAATAYVQLRIIPAMDRDRIAAGGDVDAARPDDPARLDFERLHPISENLEGAVLFLGLGVIVLMAAEPGPAPKPA